MNWSEFFVCAYKATKRVFWPTFSFTAAPFGLKSHARENLRVFLQNGLQVVCMHDHRGLARGIIHEYTRYGIQLGKKDSLNKSHI